MSLKLPNSQPDKLKSETKNKSEVTLRLSSNIFDNKYAYSL